MAPSDVETLWNNTAAYVDVVPTRSSFKALGALQLKRWTGGLVV